MRILLRLAVRLALAFTRLTELCTLSRDLLRSTVCIHRVCPSFSERILICGVSLPLSWFSSGARAPESQHGSAAGSHKSNFRNVYWPAHSHAKTLQPSSQRLRCRHRR